MSVACPACVALPEPQRAAMPPSRSDWPRVAVSVPSVHCAGCISALENGFAHMPGLAEPRVNLSLKRLTLRVDPNDAEAEGRLLARLAALGHPGDILDAGVLDAGRGTADVGRALMLRLGIAGFAAMNVMLLSVAVWAGAEGATRDFLHIVSAVIALPTALYAATPFFSNALNALKAGRLVMDTPISLAVLLSLGVSLYETFQGGEHAYFDAALSLTFFLLLGRVLDHRSRAAARSAATELAALEVPKAERPDGTIVPARDLQPGEEIRLRAGLRVPADGLILRGETEVDSSALTGETLPARRGPGDPVHAGEVNLTGGVDISVSAAGADTRLAQIAELVAASEAARNRYVTLADRAARVYAPLVHGLALVAGLWWYVTTQDARLSINIAVSVLIITCPCALGLAVPSVMVAASARLFRLGVLLKDGTALERMAEVDTVVLDKTGTLTSGVPEVSAPASEDDLSAAAGLAGGSAHPLSQSLCAEARKRGISPARVEGLRDMPGHGVEGRINGQPARLGRASWVGAEPAQGQGMSCWLKVGDARPVRFGFADQPRKGVERMLAGFAQQGLGTYLFSGDAPETTKGLARRFGIAQATGAMTPEDKQSRIAAMKAEGHRVLMLGDGLNDTAALAEANVSIAPASGIDVARNAADIVLLTPELGRVPEILVIARKARARMIENFGLAAAYNAIAIPLAVAGFATPLMAALAMSTSSILVSLNALRVSGKGAS